MRAPGSTTTPWPSHEPSPMDDRRLGLVLHRDRAVDHARSRGSCRSGRRCGPSTRRRRSRWTRWATMPLPRPIRQRSPMLTTRSGRPSWPGPQPADRVTSGAMMVSAPRWMHCGLTTVWVGKQMTLPSPNEPNAAAGARASARWRPPDGTRSQAQRISSPVARRGQPAEPVGGRGLRSSRRSTARRYPVT